MERIQCQLAKLERLWTSLSSPMDSDSLSHKLQHVIVELNRVVRLEELERRLLCADMEDTLASIETRCQYLGMPIEAVLLSELADEPIHIGHVLQHFASVNPSYAKLETLKRLDQRLRAEVGVRRKHLKRLLLEISRMTIELGQDNPCRPYESYHRDLCWAHMKQIDRIKRDLRRLLQKRRKDFEHAVFDIHYFLTLFEEKLNPEDFADSMLARVLHDKTPIKIKSVNAKPHRTLRTNYYPGLQEAQEDDKTPVPFIVLSSTVCDAMHARRAELESEYRGRRDRYNRYVKSIRAVWEELHIPHQERCEIRPSLSLGYLDQLESEFDRLKAIVRREAEDYVEKYHRKLETVSDEALLTVSERTEFIQQLYEKADTIHEVHRMVNDHINYLASLRPAANEVIRLKNQRNELIKKMIEFEESASNPKRLFQASFQLLEEERWRKTCFPTLLQMDEDLMRAVYEFERLSGKPFIYQQRRYIDTLREEIAIRNANKTFFGFLNADNRNPPSNNRVPKQQRRAETSFVQSVHKTIKNARSSEKLGEQTSAVSSGASTVTDGTSDGEVTLVGHRVQSKAYSLPVSATATSKTHDARISSSKPITPLSVYTTHPSNHRAQRQSYTLSPAASDSSRCSNSFASDDTADNSDPQDNTNKPHISIPEASTNTPPEKCEAYVTSPLHFTEHVCLDATGPTVILDEYSAEHPSFINYNSRSQDEQGVLDTAPSHPTHDLSFVKAADTNGMAAEHDALETSTPVTSNVESQDDTANPISRNTSIPHHLMHANKGDQPTIAEPPVTPMNHLHHMNNDTSSSNAPRKPAKTPTLIYTTDDPARTPVVSKSLSTPFSKSQNPGAANASNAKRQQKLKTRSLSVSKVKAPPKKDASAKPSMPSNGLSNSKSIGTESAKTRQAKALSLNLEKRKPKESRASKTLSGSFSLQTNATDSHTTPRQQKSRVSVIPLSAHERLGKRVEPVLSASQSAKVGGLNGTRGKVARQQGKPEKTRPLSDAVKQAQYEQKALLTPPVVD